MLDAPAPARLLSKLVNAALSLAVISSLSLRATLCFKRLDARSSHPLARVTAPPNALPKLSRSTMHMLPSLSARKLELASSPREIDMTHRLRLESAFVPEKFGDLTR